MVEPEVDDPVRVGRGLAQLVQVFKVPAAHVGAKGFDGGSRRFGPGQADDLVPGLEQLGHDSRGDVTAGAGDEDTHEQFSRDERPRLGRGEVM